MNEPSIVRWAAERSSTPIVSVSVLWPNEPMPASSTASFSDAFRRRSPSRSKCLTASDSALPTWMAWTAPSSSPSEPDILLVAPRAASRYDRTHPRRALVTITTATLGRKTTDATSGLTWYIT